jgi:cell division protein FtsZ
MISHTESTARIVVLGVGGGGCNAVDRMIEAGVRGVEFVALNTDQQALARSHASRRIRLGERLTRGLGAGGDPTVGAKAAEESAEEIFDVCRDADMVFIAAGMGGGTGTGASAVAAQIAQEVGALAVGVVTKPFTFEGSRRRRCADSGLATLREHLHTLLVIPNDRVLQVVDKRTPVGMAFSHVDEVLRQGIQGISELITRPGLINLDFADVKSVMSEPGMALMAIGYATGENRAIEAAQQAMGSPLLDLSMTGARGVLFNITGGIDLTLLEVNRAAEFLRQAADPDANIIFGAVIDEDMRDEVRITVIATGFDAGPTRTARPDTKPGKGHSLPAVGTERDALSTLEDLRRAWPEEASAPQPDWMRSPDRPRREG